MAKLCVLLALWLALGAATVLLLSSPDVEPCGVPSCFCGCQQKQPCRCAE